MTILSEQDLQSLKDDIAAVIKDSPNYSPYGSLTFLANKYNVNPEYVRKVKQRLNLGGN